MQAEIHPNYIKSSNLIFLTVGLGIINISLITGIFVSPEELITGLLALLFLSGLALLIRKGINWIKYPFLAMMILGLFSIPFMIKNIAIAPMVGIINVIQTVFQVWALVLLFQIPKKTN